VRERSVNTGKKVELVGDFTKRLIKKNVSQNEEKEDQVMAIYAGRELPVDEIVKYGDVMSQPTANERKEFDATNSLIRRLAIETGVFHQQMSEKFRDTTWLNLSAKHDLWIEFLKRIRESEDEHAWKTCARALQHGPSSPAKSALFTLLKVH